MNASASRSSSAVRHARPHLARQHLERPRHELRAGADRVDLVLVPQINHRRYLAPAAPEHRALSGAEHLVHRAHARDSLQPAATAVVVDQRRRLLAVDLEPLPHRLGPVVGPLDQLHVRDGRRNGARPAAARSSRLYARLHTGHSRRADSRSTSSSSVRRQAQHHVQPAARARPASRPARPPAARCAGSRPARTRAPRRARRSARAPGRSSRRPAPAARASIWRRASIPSGVPRRDRFAQHLAGRDQRPTPAAPRAAGPAFPCRRPAARAAPPSRYILWRPRMRPCFTNPS